MIEIKLKDKSSMRVPNYSIERLEKQLGIDKDKETIIILSPNLLTITNIDGTVTNMLYKVVNKSDIVSYKNVRGGEVDGI